MSKYIGDFSKNDTITFMFTTFRPSTGAPFLLAGTPVVSVYKDNNTTQDTAGVTLTTNYDGVTGLNFVSISTSTAFYVDGSSYECVITTGTVDSVSVVGSCVGRFTMRDQAYLYPTTAGRTLDASASGQVIVVTNNDKTNYSLTTAPLNATQTADSVWNALLASYTTTNSFGARVVRTLSSSTTNEVTIGGSNHIAANVHAMQNNTITAAAIATGAVDADALATDAVNEIADGLLTRSLATAGAAGNITITSIVASVFQAANSLAVNDQVTFIGTAPTSFNVGQVYYVNASSLSSTTFTLGSLPGGGASATTSTGAFTASNISGRNMLSAMRAIRNKSVISSGVLTVYQEDDTAAAWTATVGSDPSANPIISIDPA
jgi:hypothetical protein